MPGMRMMSSDRRNASGAGLTPWLQRRREAIPPAEGWKPENLIRFGFRGAIDRGALKPFVKRQKNDGEQDRGRSAAA